MDDIEKFFRKLSAKEVEALMLVFLQLQKDHTAVPGIVKLTGHKNLFRVRVGRIRIIFSLNKDQVIIMRISNRDENTYKNI